MVFAIERVIFSFKKQILCVFFNVCFITSHLHPYNFVIISPMDFTEEEVKRKLKELGYINIPAHKLQEFMTGKIQVHIIIKVLKLSPSSQVASKIKRTPRK